MRINLYGAPSSGKTSKAHEICALLKKNHADVEYVRESAKKWAYLKRIPKGFAQLRFTMNQIGKEEDFFSYGVQHIVSDSPVLLTAIYGQIYDTICKDETLKICREYEKIYPSINIMCYIKDCYNDFGRFQNKEESLKIEQHILQFLEDEKIFYYQEPIVDLNELFRYKGLI